MQPAASLGCGECVFVNRDIRRNLCGIELHCDSVRVMRTRLDEATMMTTIRGY
jgi:uncharacterized protein YuzE